MESTFHFCPPLVPTMGGGVCYCPEGNPAPLVPARKNGKRNVPASNCGVPRGSYEKKSCVQSGRDNGTGDPTSPRVIKYSNSEHPTKQDHHPIVRGGEAISSAFSR